MKIDPDVPPPPPQLATPSTPTPPGEMSPFATMLAEPPMTRPSQPVRPEGPRPEQPRDRVAQTATPDAPDPLSIVRTASPDRPAAPTHGPSRSTEPVQVPRAAAPPAPINEGIGAAEVAAAKSAVPSSSPVSGETARAPAPPTDTPSEPKPAPPRTPDRPRRDHAFNFRELGVWGLGRLLRGEPTPRTCGVEPAPVVKGARTDPPPGPEQPRALEADREPGRPNLDRLLSAIERLAPGDSAGGARTEAERDAPRSARASRPSPSPSAVAPAARDPGEVNEALTEVAVADPPTAPVEAAAPISVVVSDGPGGVQVAAVLPDINPDTVARLRRIAESLARDLGLSLSGFSLNGVAIDAPANPDRSPQWR